MRDSFGPKRFIGVIATIVVVSLIVFGLFFIIIETPKATSYSEYLWANSYREHVSIQESLPKVCSRLIVETDFEVDENGRILSVYDWAGTKDQYDQCVAELLSRNVDEFERFDYAVPYDSTYDGKPTVDDLLLPPECSAYITEIEPDWEPPKWTRLFPFLATKKAYFRFDGTEEQRHLCTLISREKLTEPAQESGISIRPPK